MGAARLSFRMCIAAVDPSGRVRRHGPQGTPSVTPAPGAALQSITTARRKPTSRNTWVRRPAVHRLYPPVIIVTARGANAECTTLVVRALMPIMPMK